MCGRTLKFRMRQGQSPKKDPSRAVCRLLETASLSPGCNCEPSRSHWRRKYYVPASARSELDVAMSGPVRRLNRDAQSRPVFQAPFVLQIPRLVALLHCLTRSADSPHAVHCSNIRNFLLFSRAQRQKRRVQGFGGLIRQFRCPLHTKLPHILPQLEMLPLLPLQHQNIGRNERIGPSSALGVALVTSMKAAFIAARITYKQHDALCATLSSTTIPHLPPLHGTRNAQLEHYQRDLLFAHSSFWSWISRIDTLRCCCAGRYSSVWSDSDDVTMKKKRVKRVERAPVCALASKKRKGRPAHQDTD